MDRRDPQPWPVPIVHRGEFASDIVISLATILIHTLVCSRIVALRRPGTVTVDAFASYLGVGIFVGLAEPPADVAWTTAA